MTMVIVFFIGLMASSVIERRTEATLVSKPMLKIGDFEPRNQLWGKNYPREYNSYYETADTSFLSLHAGNATIDMLAEDPNLVVLWAGYAFSKEYKQSRGHFYAIKDIREILRTGAPKKPEDGPQPGTCWTCKSPDVPRMMNKIGIENFYKTKWSALGPEINNFIGCADCHNPKDQSLTITRPALIEAYERQGKDVRKQPLNQMRMMVCAQCHVEYYFKGDGKYLTFPWDKGNSVDSIEKYYDSCKFSDWTHQLSRAPMIKAQHPDYEIFTTGIHYDRGVTCADCHMPYKSEGGVKFTNHHIQSPLNNISNTCQVCHRESEETLRENVYERQDKCLQLRQTAEELLVKAHFEAKAAWDAGATEKEMEPVLLLIRHAQWRWDFAAAGHGSSFHSPLEVARILSTSITKSQEARILLAKILYSHGVKNEIRLPDISTKEKAQKFIGLDMDKLYTEKDWFIKNILPEWDRKAKEREAGWKVPEL